MPGHKIMTSSSLYQGRSKGGTSVATLLQTHGDRAFQQVRRVQVRHTVSRGHAHGEMDLAARKPVSSDFLGPRRRPVHVLPWISRLGSAECSEQRPQRLALRGRHGLSCRAVDDLAPRPNDERSSRPPGHGCCHTQQDRRQPRRPPSPAHAIPSIATATPRRCTRTPTRRRPPRGHAARTICRTPPYPVVDEPPSRQ
jgi:hypothetical protein